MRNIILPFTGVLLLIASFTVAQKPEPVQWNYTARKISAKVYEVHFTASMIPHWHIYSGTQPAEAIAQPTKIDFIKNPLLVISGKLKEFGKKETYNDQAAGIVQYQYADKVDFVQLVQLKTGVQTNITGSITYQTCNDEMCLPPKTISFNIKME